MYYTFQTTTFIKRKFIEVFKLPYTLMQHFNHFAELAKAHPIEKAQ